MKLLLFAMLISISSFSQTTISDAQLQKDFAPVNAGDILIQARRSHFIGVGFSLAGAAVAGLSINKIGNGEYSALAVPSLLWVAGAFFSMRSFYLIGKAGEVLNDVSININPNSIGLCYNF